MANRKLMENAQPLDEMVAQAGHRGSVVGRNIPVLEHYFRRQGNTNGIALLRWVGSKFQEKYGSNFRGSFALNVGTAVKGEKLALPEEGRRYETICDAASVSGQELRRVGYPVTLTLYNGSSTEVAAGYTLDSRVQHEGMIGEQQLESALVYIPLLNDKDLKKKLRKLPVADVRARAKKAEESFEMLRSVPEAFAEVARRNNIDPAVLNNPELLKEGKHLADQYWSALVWAFQTKSKNDLNWLKGEAKKHNLPVDVHQAYATLKAMPHLMTRDQYVLLGAYRLQAKRDYRKGVAGNMPAELLWLANNAKAERAREMYGRPVNLAVPHEPAKFYTGSVPQQEMTVGQKLNDPYWTMADLEGVLRKFPLAEFRKKWNAQIAGETFRDADRFYRMVDYVAKVRRSDAHELKKHGGDLKQTRLGEDYNFVAGMLECAKDLKTKRFSYERLIETTPIDQTRDDFQRFVSVATRMKKLADFDRFKKSPLVDYFAP
jgi:hypothetical protein